MYRRLPSCGRREKRKACLPLSRRWMRWRSPAGWTRSSSGSATSPLPILKAACRFPAATLLAACGRAPAGSGGSHATPLRGHDATGTGLSEPASPPRPPDRPAARSAAAIRAEPGGRYTVSIAAADIGTGTWTALRQIAADALGVAIDQLALEIGDSALPPASPAGLSSGISCWGSSIVEAARRLRGRLESQHGGIVPAGGLEVTANMPENPDVARYAMHAFGAQFAEVRVNQDTGEVRVPRLLGVFDAGRIINPKTARSQLIGGMTQELSLALHEHSILDPRFGHVINHDFSGYHIASNADAVSIDAHGRRHRQRRLSRHRHPR